MIILKEYIIPKIFRTCFNIDSINNCKDAKQQFFKESWKEFSNLVLDYPQINHIQTISQNFYSFCDEYLTSYDKNFKEQDIELKNLSQKFTPEYLQILEAIAAFTLTVNKTLTSNSAIDTNQVDILEMGCA